MQKNTKKIARVIVKSINSLWDFKPSRDRDGAVYHHSLTLLRVPAYAYIRNHRPFRAMM